jgi:hypothetical protein
MMPPAMTRKLFVKFEMLGEYFAEHSAFSNEINMDLRKPFKLSPLKKIIFGALCKTGMANFYWNTKLKENGAFQERYAKPYAINTK